MNVAMAQTLSFESLKLSTFKSTINNLTTSLVKFLRIHWKMSLITCNLASFRRLNSLPLNLLEEHYLHDDQTTTDLFAQIEDRDDSLFPKQFHTLQRPIESTPIVPCKADFLESYI